MKKFSLFLVFVLLAGSIGFNVYFQKQLSELKTNPQKVAQEELKALVVEVGKVIVLPAGEDPVIATVTKPEALKEQTFFANAKEGFKVLIYQAAKKAYLYDPSAKKIVEVAPVNIGDAASKTPVTPDGNVPTDKVTPPKE
ncbi:hypothetical protein HZA38_06550 [Candidatus Peregrinibacteria bacterium]|nr:hypothetical protein [Candidatus Peregrinibacteria bacterium]